METFSALLALCGGIPQRHWREALMFSLICAWINRWVNIREAGDLRRHRILCDDIVMSNLKKPLLKPNLSMSETKVLTCWPWLVLAFRISLGRGSEGYIVWVNDLIITGWPKSFQAHWLHLDFFAKNYSCLSRFSLTIYIRIHFVFLGIAYDRRYMISYFI